VPVLFLGAEAAEREAIAQNAGPDDFVVREFDTDEVQTRVRMWLRRAESAFLRAGPPSDVELGPLRLHPDSRRVSFGQETEQLTATEFRLLCHLAQKPERVFTREELLRAVWGYEHSGYAHTLTTHVNRLRQKIEGGLGAPRLVETVRGLGYRFTSESAH
jgi:DNA-binding response OmpR family regulator